LDSPEDIAGVYRRRLDERNAALERFTKRDRLVADLRLWRFWPYSLLQADRQREGVIPDRP